MAIQSSIIVSTTFGVEGRRIREYKGVVRGITVRVPTIAQGLLGGLKSIIGGQIGA
ncbi:MAG TPA: heavy metal-binding domain-containing protein [Gemmatimonadales bacterium]|nr:heavy metal-binding domain-containing protein [Gemmatimonadales bacterium]